MKKKKDFIDDEWVIADMNFDGAPWQVENRKNIENSSSTLPPLTKKETMEIMRSALMAGLVIGLVFVVAFGMFILFSTQIWLAY
ncbi:MAG: hypothetical protein JW702_10875 [Clostridiales bacterium]|nr:hypothetical protein [Clostridiales bacterium]